MDKLYHQLFLKLYDYYGPQNWWPADTSLEIIISAILVQNTDWRNVELALENLAPYLLSPIKLASLHEKELAKIIQPIGYYNIKAKRIKAFLNWYKLYDYDLYNVKKDNINELRNELLDIYGIGEETADVILLYVFNIPVFVVDAYARRIFTRIGLHVPKKYKELKNIVENNFPRDPYLLNEYHALLVVHGKHYCKTSPLCNNCPVKDICKQKIIKG